MHKPGGKVLKNLIEGGFDGTLHVINPKERLVQNLPSHPSVTALPRVDLAILAIQASRVPAAIRELIDRGVSAFIILSAGFGELGPEGKRMEKEIVGLVDSCGGTLIGPNSIGVLTPHYRGVFTEPIPKLHPRGCDLISSSGATAVFILEAGIAKGLQFASVFSVGNSAQIGVEEILEHMDLTYDSEEYAPVKLLYIESIRDPRKLLRHAASLRRKGCRIAGVKAGVSEAGSRAASSHTGALASPDVFVDALFRKAGIVRCEGREELIAVACVLANKPLTGRRFAVITHAGGPGVLLTDALAKGGFEIPPILRADELLARLLPGSSVANPIDFLATGTAEHLREIIEHVARTQNIDALAVIFGTPGLVPVFDAYRVLKNAMATLEKPIFSVLPSPLTAREEVSEFIASGHSFFTDEVILARALASVAATPLPAAEVLETAIADVADARCIHASTVDGYLNSEDANALLDSVGIPRVAHARVDSEVELLPAAAQLGYPLVLKATGVLHKTDAGAVALDIRTETELRTAYRRVRQLPGVTGFVLQPMIGGIELYCGAKWAKGFGHVVLFGVGGIYVEQIRDAAVALAPLTQDEAHALIRSIRAYPILAGARGKKPVDESQLADVIYRVSELLRSAPWIVEMDINPLFADGTNILATDVRVRSAMP